MYNQDEEYSVYGKVNCSACDVAVNLLKSNKKEYVKLLLDVHFSVVDLYQVAPRTVKSFPVILKGGKYLGGLKELKLDLGADSDNI